jgi:hypothetical protein
MFFSHEKHKRARKKGEAGLKLRNEIGLNCAMKMQIAANCKVNGF